MKTEVWGQPPTGENRLQSQCFLWFWNNYPEHRQMLFHVQNKARNAIEGNKFKAMGVVPGVSDLILILPAARIIFIEMKVGEGRQSPHQVSFQDKVTKRGHSYVIIRTFEEFKSLIEYCLNLKDES